MVATSTTEVIGKRTRSKSQLEDVLLPAEKQAKLQSDRLGNEKTSQPQNNKKVELKSLRKIVEFKLIQLMILSAEFIN